MVRLLIGLLMGVVLVSCGLAQTQAVDPTKDERLKQTLSLRIASAPLHKALQLITKQTDVTLRVDDALHQHRVVLYAPDQPLHLVMEHIAQAFDYQWKRIELDNEPPVYRLVDPNPLPDADVDWRWLREKLLPRLCQEFSKPLNQRIAKAKDITAQGNALFREALSKDLVEALATFLSLSPDHTPALRALCGLSEREWKRLQNGELLLFSTDDGTLPIQALDEWKALKEEATRHFYQRRESSGDRRFAGKNLDERLQEIGSGQELRVALWYSPSAKQLFSHFAVLDSEGRNVNELRIGRRSVSGKDLSDYLILPAQPTLLLYQGLSKSEPEGAFPQHRGFQKRLDQYRPPSVQDDWFSWFGELMVQMAEASDICLVAEYYPFHTNAFYVGWDRSLSMPLDWNRFYEILYTAGYVAKRSEQEWLVVQHRRLVDPPYSSSGVVQGYVRHLDIPQAKLERWFYKPNARGMLTLEECAEITALPPKTFSNIMTTLEGYFSLFGDKVSLRSLDSWEMTVLEPLHGGIAYAYTSLLMMTGVTNTLYSEDGEERGSALVPPYALRLYGQLTPAQRALLKRGGSLPFLLLSPPQQVLFLQAISNGDLLSVEALWLSPDQRLEVLEGADVRLVADVLEAPAEGVSPSEAKRFKTLEEYIENCDDIKQEKIKMRIRMWRLEFHWDGENYVHRFLTPYPLEREPK